MKQLCLKHLMIFPLLIAAFTSHWIETGRQYRNEILAPGTLQADGTMQTHAWGLLTLLVHKLSFCPCHPLLVAISSLSCSSSQVLSSYFSPIQKVSHIFFIHPHKTRHFPLFNPSFISHFLHASACHILFLLHSVRPPHTTRATINPPLPPAFMPLWSPGVPPTFSPPLCISAPRCGSPHPPSMAKVLLWPLTHSHCWCQRQTHKHWTKNKPTCSPSLLCFPPTSWFFLQTQRVFTTNMLQLLPHFTAQFCSAPTLLHSTDFYPAKARAEQSKPCKLCQLLLLPLLLPWHASACSSQGGSLELATGLFGGLPASWMCQPLRQLHPTPTDMLCSSNWPPWRVFCLCLQSTDVQKANHANLR